MLFRKNIEKYCAHCAHALHIGEDGMYCRYRGVVSRLHRCRKFSYDPIKRIPPAPRPISVPEAEKLTL